MKQKLLVLIAVLLTGVCTKAQMFGVYNVPGTFSSVAAACASLTAGGVGGPVTINVFAGYTETAPLGGISLGPIVGASATNSIIIRKVGVGANPLISAFVGTATPSSAIQDGIFRFVGADWVTIDGIDLTDGNTSNPASMEYGFGFFKASATDGCQNNTITNCVITLNRVNNATGSGPALEGSRGIDVVNSLWTSHTSNVTITSAGGSNSNNKFYANTIQNCNIGISIQGFAASSPFTLADSGNDIGGNSSATGNTIINYGGGTSPSNPATGVATLNQYSLNVSYNTINNNTGAGVNHAQVLRGIFLNTATSAGATVSNNTITLKSAGTTQAAAAITNNSGSTAASNTISIVNNLITNCSYTTATSGIFNAIINGGTPQDLFISNNTISNITHSGTGTDVLIETGSPVNATTNSNTITAVIRTGASGAVRIIKTTSPTNWTATNNLIDNIAWTTNTSTGSMSGFYSLSSAVNVTLSNNIIRNMALPGNGTLEGIREFGVSGIKTIQNNQIYNFTTTASGTVESTFIGIASQTGSVTISGNQIYSLSITGGTNNVVNGILVSGGTLSNVYKNKIYSLGATSTSPTIIGINITGGTTNNVYNNLVGSFNVAAANGANALIGLNLTGGSTNNVYYNSVYLNSTSAGTLFGSSALFASTTPNLNLRNNILVNNSAPVGTGITSAFRRSSTTLTTYSASSNNNLYYAGPAAANRLLFYDGTNSIQILGNLKILVFNRDANSVTENPPFLSTVGSSGNFLNIDPTIPTQVQDGALPVAGISDDYAGTVRSTTSPDIGAWEGNYTSLQACTGMPATSIASSSQSLICPGIPFNLFSTATFTESGITFQWQASTTSSTSGFSAVSNATTANAVVTVSATTWFQLAISCSNSGSVSTSAPILVTAGLPTIAAIINTTQVCGTTTSVNLSLNASPVGVGYQWVTSTTGSATGYAAITGATLSTRSNTGAIGTNWFTSVVSCTADPTYSVAASPVSMTAGAVPTVAISGPTSPICVSAVLTLSATSNVGTVFSWTGPNSYAATGASVSLAPMSGNFNVVSALGTCSSVPAVITVTAVGRTFTNNIVASTTSVCNSGSSTLSFSNTPDVYSFSQSSALPLLTLTSPATVVPSSVDDTPMAAAANIGFTFNFYGTNYTQFSASPDGWILLGNGTASADWTNVCLATTNIPKIFPYWDDLATGTNGYVRTALLGSAPSRTFVVEWFVTIPRATAGAANSTFQLCLVETTNNIYFRYGTMGTPTQSSSGGLTVNTSTFSSITFSTNNASTVTANDNNIAVPASGSGYIYTAPQNPTYSWSPSAGLSSTTASLVTATLTTSTIYTLNLDVQGCVTTKTVAVNVFTTPVVNATSSTPTVCPGGSATLTATGAPSYSWNTGANASTISVTPPVNNNNNYTVTGINGVCSATALVTVNRLPGPPIVVTGPTGICPPDQATLTASGALSYTWSTSANTNSIVVTPTAPTLYTVTGVDASGCLASVQRYLNVNSSLALNGTAPSTACAGQSITITVNGANTYSWSTNATTNSITPSPTATTIYSVVGTSGSCSGSIAVTVSVIPMPTLSVAGNMTICSGQTTTLTASGATTYSWSTGASTSSVSVAPTSNVTYTLSGFNALCQSTIPVAVVSNSLPVITITQPSASVCFSTSTSLTANGANTYTWVNGPVAQVNNITPTVATVYTVNGTSQQGCVASKTISQGVFALPNIVVSPASPTVCQDTPFNYTATGASTYTWNGSVTGSNVPLSTPSNTTFTVTGTNANGCVNTTTVAISTLSLPIVSTSPSAATICALAATSFTASGANSYFWNSTTGGSVFIAAPPSSTVISVVGTATNGCSATATIAVTTLTLPVIAVSPSSLITCALSTESFTASGAVTYTWSNAIQGPTTSITPPTSTVLSVSGTNPEGCVSTQVVSVLTNTLPVLTVAPAQPTVCANAPATFTANGANSFTWSTGPQTNTAVITSTANTVYTVSGTSTLTGCVGTKTFAVATLSAPVLSILPAASASACVNDVITFTAQGANTFSWSTGAFGPQINITASVAAVFTVTGKTSQNCSATKTVSVGLFPASSLTITANATTLCAKESLSLNAQGASTYTWLPYNATGATFTIHPTGTLKYVLVGRDANGCYSQDSIRITVDKCTGITKNAVDAGLIGIYPNPSNGRIHADMNFEGTKVIRIYDAIGALIYEMSTVSNSEDIDISTKAKGIYFVAVSAGGDESRFRIIVQ